MANTQRQNGSIVYSFATPHERKGKTLYVNVVPKYECTNSCRFCGRKDAIAGKPNIYEQKAGANLYLRQAPWVSGIMRELKPQIKWPFLGIFGGTKEIAFVGLGEPLVPPFKFHLVCETIRAIRDYGFNGKIRVDTNGQLEYDGPLTAFFDGRLMLNVPAFQARKLAKAGLTHIRISVNATNPGDYRMLCRPRIKDAFKKVLYFVHDCKFEGIHTSVSFVVGFKDDKVQTRSAEEYKAFAKARLGIKPKDVIIRKYIPPIAEGKQ